METAAQQRVTVVAPLPQDVNTAIQAMRQHKVLGVDTETTGLNPRHNTIRLIQISSGRETWVFDVWEHARYGMGLSALDVIFDDPDILKVFHNAKFDLAFLRQKLLFEPLPIFDTMLAAAVLNLPWSLSGLVKHLFDEELAKEEQASDWGAASLSTEQIEYAARDAAVLPRLRRRLNMELSAAGMEEIARIENGCVPAVAEMELSGLRLDRERWAEMRVQHEGERAKAAKEFFGCLTPPDQGALDLGAENEPPTINLNSPKQVKEAFAELGIYLENTQAGTLERIKHPAAAALCQVKKHEKLLNTYLRKYEGFIDEADNRIHPEFNQMRAKTGRFSCKNPNVQQIPVRNFPEFREAFIAGDGNLLITADYSQIEYRLLAELSGDEGLIEGFKSGIDVHTRTASMMFGVEPDKVTKQQRADAKNMNFAMVYQQGDPASAAQMGVSVNVVKERKAEYFGAMPKVQEWIRKQKAMGERRQLLHTVGGRRFYSDENRPATTAVNYPIQGSSADITKLALANLYRTFREVYRGKEGRPRIINTVHDEIQVEVPADKAEEVATCVKKEMMRAGEAYLSLVPCDVDVNIARSWTK